jgi:DNA polymerase III sliding clamp (beta) subunit (PCNA family)
MSTSSSVQTFSIQVKDAIATLLPIAVFASSVRSQIDVYKHVLIRSNGAQCFGVACNGAQTIIRSMPLPMLSEPFKVCIDGSKLAAILGSLKDCASETMNITWTDAVATIKVGRSKLTAQVVDPDSFPEPQKLSDEHSSIVMPSSVLLSSIKSVSHSCAANDARNYLNGCYFNFNASGFSVIGSDGHRISRVCKPIVSNAQTNSSGIFPKRLIEVLSSTLDKVGDVRIRLTTTMVELTMQGCQVRSVLIDGKYPDTATFFVGNEQPLFRATKQSVTNALNRLKATIYEKLPAVSIEADNNEVKLSTLDEKNQESGLDYVQADVVDQSLKISMNISYLSDALQQVDDDDTVIFSVVTASSIKISSTKNADFSAVIAQLRR